MKNKLQTDDVDIDVVCHRLLFMERQCRYQLGVLQSAADVLAELIEMLPDHGLPSAEKEELCMFAIRARQGCHAASEALNQAGIQAEILAQLTRPPPESTN